MARFFEGILQAAGEDRIIMFNRYLDSLDVEKAIGKLPTDKSKVDAWRRQEAMLRLYKNGSGIYIPSHTIRATMAKGASAQNLKHVQVKGQPIALGPFIERGVTVKPLELLFGVENTDELHREMVKIPPKKGAMVPKYWPLLRDWQLSFKLVVVDDSLQEESELKASLQAAGLFCGLGTCRNLGYGRFSVTAWEEVSE